MLLFDSQSRHGSRVKNPSRAICGSEMQNTCTHKKCKELEKVASINFFSRYAANRISLCMNTHVSHLKVGLVVRFTKRYSYGIKS